MRFCFHLSACAVNNSAFAQSREATRMALICMALRAQGHDAVIADAPGALLVNPRWQYFSSAYSPNASGGLNVVPAESLRGDRTADIAFKCSVGCDHDAERIKRVGLYVAHEYSDALETSEKLLPVPFMVHDCVFDHLVEVGLFQQFIDNTLKPIREYFRDGAVTNDKPLGVCCQNWPHRLEILESAPEWVEWIAYQPGQQPMTGWDHARWLMGFKAALCIRGDSPKTNLPSLCAMLGVPIVFHPIPKRDTPAFDATNTILFESWEQVERSISVGSILTAVEMNATEDYLRGWSHVGQARLIAEKCNG